MPTKSVARTLTLELSAEPDREQGRWLWEYTGYMCMRAWHQDSQVDRMLVFGVVKRIMTCTSILYGRLPYQIVEWYEEFERRGWHPQTLGFYFSELQTVLWLPGGVLYPPPGTYLYYQNKACHSASVCQDGIGALRMFFPLS